MYRAQYRIAKNYLRSELLKLDHAWETFCENHSADERILPKKWEVSLNLKETLHLTVRFGIQKKTIKYPNLDLVVAASHKQFDRFHGFQMIILRGLLESEHFKNC